MYEANAVLYPRGRCDAQVMLVLLRPNAYLAKQARPAINILVSNLRHNFDVYNLLDDIIACS